MRAVLSSWKEIAAYLGKGVRTVQRWERELDLPVRRPKPNEKQIVLAFPDELDAWVRRQSEHRRPEYNGDTNRQELKRLRELIERTVSETRRLQAATEQIIKMHSVRTGIIHDRERKAS
jgi:hypothetical protein